MVRTGIQSVSNIWVCAVDMKASQAECKPCALYRLHAICATLLFQKRVLTAWPKTPDHKAISKSSLVFESCQAIYVRFVDTADKAEMQMQHRTEDLHTNLTEIVCQVHMQQKQRTVAASLARQAAKLSCAVSCSASLSDGSRV